MKKIPFFPLRIRLLLLLVISLIPGIVLTIYTLQEERQRANVQAQDFAYRVANVISVRQRDLIVATENYLFAVSQIPGIGRGSNGRLLAQLLASRCPFSDIGIADTEGNIIASAIPTSKHINIADRRYFHAAMETGNFVVGEYQTSRTTGRPSINFAYPIDGESGKRLGVLFAELNLEELRDLESLVGTQLPEGWTLFVIDRDGILLAQYPDGHSNIGRRLSELSGKLKEVTHIEGTIWGTDSTNRSHLYARSEVRTSFFPNGISVVLDIPGEYAISAVNRMFNRSFVVLSVFGFVVLLVGGIGNEFYLVRGLSAVRNAAVQLAGGDFRARIGRVRGLKEVRDLGKVFNDMSAMIESREIERQRAEASLRESEERYRALFTCSTDALFVHVEGKVTIANPALCFLLGADEPSQIVGKSVLEIVHPEYHEKVRERWELISRGHPVPLLEEKYVRLGGSMVDVEVSAAPIDWQGSKGVQVVARDISERKKAESALKASMEQLHSLAQRLERAREEERKEISHEVHDQVGQVMTALKMDLISLQDYGPSQGSGFQEKIKSSLELADKAIETVQNIASRLRPEMLDYLGLLAATEWLTEEFQKRSGIQCSIDLPEQEPSIDSERATALFRILQEALTNVARHAHAKKVDIQLTETDNAFRMSIADDGVGISQGELRNPKSLGLMGMQERLYPFKGTCVIQRGSRGGTEVLIELPTKTSFEQEP